MFGRNKILKQDLRDDGKLWVEEIFPTIQGEGPLAGRPAIFVRLCGCNLKCFFCDTSFESFQDFYTPKQILEKVQSFIQLDVISTDLVVLTGGEPLRQNIAPLCKMLVEDGFRVQIETSGTLWVDGLESLVQLSLAGSEPGVSIICSPKTGKVHPKIEEYCIAWKYIVSENSCSSYDGLPVMSTQIPDRKNKLYRPKDLSNIYIQPCDDHDETANKINNLYALRIAMRFGYKLSVQIHKYVGAP